MVYETNSGNYTKNEGHRPSNADGPRVYASAHPLPPRPSALRTLKDISDACDQAHEERMKWLNSLPPEAKKKMEGELGFLGAF